VPESPLSGENAHTTKKYSFQIVEIKTVAKSGRFMPNRPPAEWLED
jgi:hypothetical protein